LFKRQWHGHDRDPGSQSVQHGVEAAVQYRGRALVQDLGLRQERPDQWITGKRGGFAVAQPAAMRYHRTSPNSGACARHRCKQRSPRTLQGSERTEYQRPLVLHREGFCLFAKPPW